MLKWLFRKVDFIGNDVQFNIDGKNRYQSVTGGLFSTLMGLIVVGLILSFGWDLFYKINSRVTYSKEFQDHGNLNFTSNFPLMLTLIKRGAATFENPRTYFNIHIENFNRSVGADGNPTKNNPPVDSGPCTKEDLGPNPDLYLSQASIPDLSYYTCIKQNQRLEVFGTLGSKKFNYMTILINRCANGTESGVVCKPLEEINSVLDTGYIMLLAPDKYFDAKQYNDPGQHYVKVFSLPLSTQVYKRYYMYYKNVEYMTDQGSFFRDFMNQTYYQFDTNTLELFFNPKLVRYTPNTVAEITIAASPIKDVYYRLYYKLQNLAADIGGIIKSLLIIITLLNEFLNRKVMHGWIYNSLFILKDKDDKEKSELRSEYKLTGNQSSNIFDLAPKSTNMIHNNNYITKNNLKANNNNLELSKLNYENFNKKYVKLTKGKYGYLDILCPCFNKRKRKNLLDSHKIIKNFLNIRTIIQKLNDIEVMKKTTYNNDQKVMFRYLTTEVHLEKEADNVYIDDNKAILDKINNNANSQMDKRIIEMILK